MIRKVIGAKKTPVTKGVQEEEKKGKTKPSKKG